MAALRDLAAELEGTTDPSDWTFPPLKDLDGLLRCPICFEYFKTTVVIPACSHNYCSLCIRRFFATKQQCPTCSQPATEADIKCNRLLDEVVQSFTANRRHFMALVQSSTVATPHKGSKGSSGMQSAMPHKGSSTTPITGQMSEGSSANSATPTTRTRSSLLNGATPTTHHWLEGSSTNTKPCVTTAAAGKSIRDRSRRPETESPVVRAESKGKSSMLTLKGKSPVCPQGSGASVSLNNTTSLHVPEPPDMPFTFDLTDFESQDEPTMPPLKKPCPTRTTPTRGRTSSPTRPSLPRQHKTSLNHDLSVAAENTYKSKNGTVPSVNVSQGTCHNGLTTSVVGPVIGGVSSSVSAANVPAPVISGAPAVGPGVSAANVPAPVISGVATGSAPVVNGVEARKEVVECPVCTMKMQQHLINSHLDLCLNGSLLPPSTTTPSPSPSMTQTAHSRITYQRKGSLPPLRKVVFSIMTDKQLRKKLKDYTLPTNGSRNTMIARLEEFTLQYKAQSDSLNPKSMKEIALEIESTEKDRDAVKKYHITNSLMQTSRRNTSGSDLEQERKSYEQSHKEQFAKLVATMQEWGSKEGRSPKDTQCLEGQSPKEGRDLKVGQSLSGESSKQREQNSEEGQSTKKEGQCSKNGLERGGKVSRVNGAHHTPTRATTTTTTARRANHVIPNSHVITTVAVMEPVVRNGGVAIETPGGQSSAGQESSSEVLVAESPERVVEAVAMDDPDASTTSTIPESPPLTPSPSLLRSSTRRKRPRPPLSPCDSTLSPDKLSWDKGQSAESKQCDLDFTPHRTSKRLRRRV